MKPGFLASNGFSPPHPTRVSDGDVQRHIFRLHRDEFRDSWRVCGDFLAVTVNPALIDDSPYSIDDDCVAAFAGMPGPFPAIVLDYDGDIIDGGHRLAAAKLRGDAEIAVLAQIEDIQEDPVEN